MRASTTALFSALLLTACDEETVCDASAMASVTITVTDLDGEPLSPTALTYTIDGGQAQDAECMSDDCSSAVAGWEQAGVFEITAVLDEEMEGDPCCWYLDSQTVEVEVTQGECHVDGQQVEIQLDTDALVCADSTEDCG